jgi:hypothetical protein
MATTLVSFCDLLRPRPRGSCCIRLPPDIVHDPDPAIYDQRQIFMGGGAPSFNSPDLNTIDIWPVRPIDNLTATIRNLSQDASANQTRIDWSWSAWGIGLERQPIASTFVDLARAGFPGSEGTFALPLPPALNAAGRYGIFVRLIHPYDKDINNNEGEQTLDGFQTSQGRAKTFVVPVRNSQSGVQTFTLTAGPAAFAPWVVVAPATFTLAPGAQQNVMVSVTVPNAIGPSPPGTLISATIDVVATAAGAYFGGISIIVLFDA